MVRESGKGREAGDLGVVAPVSVILTVILRFEKAVTNAGLDATLGLARPAAGSGDPITGTLSLFDAKGAQIEENRFVDVEAVRLSDNADKLTILAPANDNDNRAWRGAAFCFAGVAGRIAA